MTVNKDRVELFAAALESDRYRQCSETLQQLGYNPETGETVTFNCALGVAVAVAQINGLTLPADAWAHGNLPSKVRGWYGFESPDPHAGPHDRSISYLNDSGSSFWEIAQAVRATYLKD